MTSLENSTKGICYGQFINLITSVIFGLDLIMSSIEKQHDMFYRYGWSMRSIYPVLYGIEIFLYCFGPISSAVELILCQIINSLSDLYDDWTFILRYYNELGSKTSNGDNDDLECDSGKDVICVEHGKM